MSDLMQTIQLLNQSVTVSRKKHLYFNKDDGSIIEITNVFEEKEDFGYMLIDLDQVIEILNGKKNTGNFKVEYNLLQQEYQLIEISSLSKPSLFLYEIPVYTNNEEKDLILTYNKKTNKLHFSLTTKAKSELKTKVVYNEKIIPFYITEKGNPDSLLTIVDVKVKDLLWGNIFEAYIGDFGNLMDISVLTYNYFSGYILEVINE